VVKGVGGRHYLSVHSSSTIWVDSVRPIQGWRLRATCSTWLADCKRVLVGRLLTP